MRRQTFVYPRMESEKPTDGQPGLDNTEKDPDHWVTGDEPATGAQMSYLHTLAEAKGEEVPEGLTKSEASKLIDRLKQEKGG